MKEFEKFWALPEEKQNIIIDAALQVFGKMGYKKASAQDIAKIAGISKAMIFFYFGSKKKMYLFLLQFAGNFVVQEIENHRVIMSTTDFFERIRLSAEIKLETISKHPDLLSFFANIYFETSPEVKTEIKEYIEKSKEIRKRITQNNIDISKFKEGIDPDLVMKLLNWAAEGYANQFQDNYLEINEDFSEFMKEFCSCLDMMKNNFYKETEI